MTAQCTKAIQADRLLGLSMHRETLPFMARPVQTNPPQFDSYA
jgi:hypothetical protein